MAKEKTKEVLNKISAKAKDLKIKERFEQIKIKEKFEKMTEGMPIEMQKRIGSALVIIPVILFFIYLSSSLFMLLILASAICMTYEWVDITNPADEKLFWRATGLVYILAPCFSLIVIRNLTGGADIILWLFMIIWATDTSAYFVGSNLKGPKLAPKISPNKTWSGLAGGVIASMLVGLVASLMFKESSMFFIAFSGLLAVVAQIGDLFESKIKRMFGVKSSGNLIPGHGGILDRVDGFTLASPLVMLIAILSKNVF